MKRMYFHRGLGLVFTAILALPVAAAADQQPAPPVEIVDVTGAERLGPEDAPATLVIFADLGAGSAGSLGVLLHGLAERYPTALRVFFRHAPPADREEHVLAHLAAIAAGGQGKFWEMFDLLLANQARQQREQILAMAGQLQLDTARFAEDIDGAVAHGRVELDQQQATGLKVVANPTYFVNGVRLSGGKSLKELTTQIDAAIAGRVQD